MEQLLSPDRVRVFHDGTLSDPQLDHPEGLAVGGDGSIWCGGERGQIYRIEPDGEGLKVVADTGGFCLGMAFGPDGGLYVCDLKRAAVVRVDPADGRVEIFAEGADGHPFRIPNFPVFDARGNLYVSDSHGQGEPGPGIFRFGADGSGELWYGEPLDFANGMALSPDRVDLYVAETFANRILRLPLGEGASREPQEVARLPGVLPDGLAFDVEGNLYVACYEPSQILRIDPKGGVACLFRDPEAHLLCHPTNVAFRDGTLFAANLGRWHITALEVGVRGLPLA